MKKIIYIIICLILSVLFFILGRRSMLKNMDTNKITLIQQKLEEQKKRNEELIEHINNCERIIHQLKCDNDDLSDKINMINSYTSETKNNLNAISSDINSTLEYLEILKNNNALLQEYIKNVESIADE